MKHKSFLLLMVALLTTIATHAYTFKSGDLYYNTTSDNTVEVTYQKFQSESNYQGLTTATIPETVTYNGTTYSVTSIGNYAFEHCTSLTSIILPNSVTSIGARAFGGCSALTSITLPNSVTSIGSWAFYNCSSLTSITIPNSVTTIGDYAFRYCASLTSITIPNSVTSIGNYAFYNVPNVVYNGSATGSPWGARSVNGYVDGYLVYADETKTNLLACSALATGEITIPNSVTSIGNYAFSHCSALTSVIIPNSVTSIGNYAFDYCSALTSITCYAPIPPTCNSNSFYEVPRTIPLYVLAESIEAYKAADTWKEFQVQALPPSYSPVDLVSITVDGEEIADFDPKVLTYDIALPEGTTTIPTIGATAYNEEAQVLLIQATTLPGQASAVVITTDSTQTYTIYFSKKSTPTDISDRPDTTGTDSDKGAEKLLRNGQVLIICNGKTYNMMGQRL